MSAVIPVTPVQSSRRPGLDLGQIQFGSVFSDHMLIARYSDGEWRTAAIEPYRPIPLPASISALQYGVAVFEGLKAFRSVAGDVALFRPHENFRRLETSCRRLVLPEVPKEIFIDGMKQLVGVDRSWVPGSDEGSLYIRPCVFGIDENIRVRPPSSCLFVMFTCPVGPYYAEPLRLMATTKYVRAFPGGTGDVKPGGNYAAALLAEQEAQQNGYHSTLWLDGREHRYVEEAGVMNIFFVIGGKVVTPNLTGTILPGVTRDSVIALLRDMGTPLEERPILIDEIVEAHRRGQLQECFGTGTAATVAHVSEIGYMNQNLKLPPVDQREIGPAVLEEMNKLRTGRAKDRFGWLVPV